MRWELILHDKQASSGQGFKTDQVQGAVPGPGPDWIRPCLRPLELKGAAQNSGDSLTGAANASSRLRFFRESLNFLKNPPLCDKAHGPCAKLFSYTRKPVIVDHCLQRTLELGCYLHLRPVHPDWDHHG